MLSITMTATEVTKELRKRGTKVTTKKIVDGIEDGTYPFGRIVSTGETGRRSVEIFRVRFFAWLHELMPSEN
jgi:hypothetical protein